MRTLLTAGAIALTASLATATILSTDAIADNAHRWCPPAAPVVEFDDMWDTGNPQKRICRFNKRKCVEIASKLAFRMAESGAYADLNDNEFAAFAIKVAAHIVDNKYVHNENEGSPVDGDDTED